MHQRPRPNIPARIGLNPNRRARNCKLFVATMRRVASGASVAPLAAQLSPVLSVAAREGPYAFKFEGLTLWLAWRPRPYRLRPRGRRRRAAAGRKRAKCALQTRDSVAMR